MGLFKNKAAAKVAADQPEAEPGTDSGAPAAGISGAEMQRLWSDGLPARATVTEIHDTGRRVAGHALLDLELAVTREGDEPYATTLRLPVAQDSNPFARGSEYNVRVDPQDQTRLVFAA